MAAESDMTQVRLIIDKYLRRLKRQKINVQQLFLFGSYAKGTAHENSDIDIAVISEDFKGDPIDDIVGLMRLRRGIDLRIEPHPFLPEDFEASNPEVAEIVGTGIRII